MRLRHAVQREVGRLVSPLWVPLAGMVLRFYFGYRIRDLAEVRRRYQTIRRQADGPLLVCANHLTLIDSFIIAWALTNPLHYVLHFNELPWNTPERTNFGATLVQRVLIYLAKCIPIQRGGSRGEVAAVLERVIHLTQRGETALVFPEAGRSRTGRVEPDSGAWGVGRIVGAVPGCRVLCIYMRGDRQETFSDFPKRGDRIYVDSICIEPKSDARGARRSRDLAQQIVNQLVRMEEKYFDGRQ